jgi:hypothetical protein
MWYVSSPVSMTISQSSPDRLIFHPHCRSIVLFQITFWILIFIFLGVIGISIFVLGLVFSKIMSKSFALSYTAILNDVQTLILIILSIVIITTAATISFYLLLCLFRFARITRSCTFERIMPDSDRPCSGEVSIEQFNIFNRKKVIKIIPFNEVVDLQLQYGANTPSRDLQILLITNQSVRPIVIDNFPHNFSKTESQKTLQLMAEEVDKIRAFINLPIKPSYLVDGSGDYSTAILAHKSKQKIVEHTPDVLTFTSLFSDARRTWSFDLKSESVTINYRLVILSFVKTIKTSEIKSIAIKRESSVLIVAIRELLLLMPITGKFLFELDRDRYSLIAILNDGSSFKCNNNYIRIFTSTDLSTVREFAELVRSHLNLPDRAASEPNFISRSERLTTAKSS